MTTEDTQPDSGPDSEHDVNDRLFAELYTELHQIARSMMARQSNDHTLQATALLGEAFMRLSKQGKSEWENEKHFVMTAAQAMRHVLVDHARARSAAKRVGKRVQSPLDAVVVEVEESAVDLERLGDALDELGEADAQMAKGIDLMFFAGLGMKETAEMVGLPLRTFERRWKATRAWLHKRVG